jgi:thiamine-monophosphate kinase
MTGSSERLSEVSIIDVFRRHFSGVRQDVVLGIGDDAAVTSLPAGRELVTATDTLVEGTHFLPGASAASVGHRVLAVNLSDLAAMGAAAHWATLSLSLPEADGEWVRQFAGGFAALANEFDVALVGGDTVRGPLSATVTVMGSVPAGEFVRRSGARVGDAIYLSGQPGCAAAGRGLSAGELHLDATQPRSQAYLQHFEYPRPRLLLGAALRTLASAMIDVSDGVHTDLRRLLTASKVGAEAAVPDLGSLTADFGLEVARELFLAGGEDYELCFCAPAKYSEDVRRLAVEHAVSISCIGVVAETPGLTWRENGKRVEPTGESFEHFRV